MSRNAVESLHQAVDLGMLGSVSGGELGAAVQLHAVELHAELSFLRMKSGRQHMKAQTAHAGCHAIL